MRTAALAAAIMVLAHQAHAAERFPNRPVRWVVPFAPGGGTDGVARVVGPRLTEVWGQQVVIDNRGGAQGSLGTVIGLRSAPDGHTITMIASGMAINPHVYKSAGYAIRDMASVGRLTEAPLVLTAHPSVPAKTLKELAVYGKQNPKKLTHGHAVVLTQLTGELFNQAAGTEILGVPYKGAGAAVIDLIAGHVSLVFSTPTSVLPHIKAGKLRGLAVLGSRRLETLPDVPTAGESGYPEISNVIEWYGVVVPATTPRALVSALNAGLMRAMAVAEVQQRLQAIGLTPAASAPEVFEAQIRGDYERWGKVVKTSGIQVSD